MDHPARDQVDFAAKPLFLAQLLKQERSIRPLIFTRTSMARTRW